MTGFTVQVISWWMTDGSTAPIEEATDPRIL